LKTLKLAQKPYYFLVCDAKPYGLIVSKKDIRKSAQAKKELTKIAGGSTRTPKFGECHCDGGKYVFEMEKPPSGLARILQKWIKENTGLGVKVMVGTESADDEGEQPDAAQPKGAEEKQKTPAAEQSKGAEEKQKAAAEPKEAAAKQKAAAAPSKPPTEKEAEALEDRRREFKKARATWVAVKNKAEQDLEKVKDGMQMAYIADTKQFPKVVQGCKDIDAILDSLDDELRDTL